MIFNSCVIVKYITVNITAETDSFKKIIVLAMEVETKRNLFKYIITIDIARFG